jgi:hypothetical protein
MPKDLTSPLGLLKVFLFEIHGQIVYREARLQLCNLQQRSMVIESEVDIGWKVTSKDTTISASIVHKQRLVPYDLNSPYR